MFRLLTDRGLPAPTTQVTVVLNGGATSRLDFAWVAERVALEVDGFSTTTGRNGSSPIVFVRTCSPVRGGTSFG